MQKILVTPQELADHLAEWVVMDTRHDLMDTEKGRRAYAEGHIPGAHFIHMDTDLAGEHTGKNGRHPLPDPATFAQRMAACGVAPGRKVVIYDDAGGSAAVRLWWLLQWLGHDDVALLDGGWPRWVKEGRPVSTATPQPAQGAFTPRPELGATVDAHYVERYRTQPRTKLIDARSAERFQGKQEPLDPVAGHIPGAVNRFWKENLGADGNFKPADVLRREFETLLGDAEAAQVVHSCGSGVTACHNIFAMRLAGLAAGRLYPGSWSEWCADPARPVATGP